MTKKHAKLFSMQSVKHILGTLSDYYSNESDISIFELSIYQQTKSKVDFFLEKRLSKIDVQN